MIRKIHIQKLKQILILSLISIGFTSNIFAHGDPNVTIHTFQNGETWKNCSFMIDPTLTQNEFHRFTREAGNIVYFQPLSGASALGKGRFNLGISMTSTAIDQSTGAWNNTFAHPISEAGEKPHFLGDRVKIPNIRFAIGITNSMDLGMFITRDFNANYGFWGADLKYSKLMHENKNIYVAGRLSHTQMFGPADLKLNHTAADILISKRWKFFEPFAGFSTSLSRAIETTNKVNLKNETIVMPRAIVGVKANYRALSAALEYDYCAVQTVSFKVGITM